MNTLRRRWSAGRVSLETPVIYLSGSNGRKGLLVLTAHLGEPAYFAGLQELLDGRGNVFFEGVRAVDQDPSHWRDAPHRFLRELRDAYSGLAGLDLLAFQGQALTPRESWINADVTCCELADKLRAEGVRLWRQEAALKALRQILLRADRGDERAARAIVRALQYGLLAASVSAIFSVLSWLPSTRAFFRVINGWRSERAAARVLEAAPADFSLVYGAAHGESILKELRRAGYREAKREWRTVFTL